MMTMMMISLRVYLQPVSLRAPLQPDCLRVCLHLHLSLNRRGCWYFTDNFTTSFLYLSFLHGPLALGELQACPFPVVVFPPLFSPSCPLLPFTVPCMTVFVRTDEQETCLCHFNLRLYTMVRSSCGPIACWTLARTSSLVTWSLYETRTILL